MKNVKSGLMKGGLKQNLMLQSVRETTILQLIVQEIHQNINGECHQLIMTILKLQ